MNPEPTNHEIATQLTQPDHAPTGGGSDAHPSQNHGNDPQLPQQTEEQKKYRLTQQFNDWLRYFLDRSNPTTYGNKTQSAIAAYQLDPVKQYATAGHIGWENYKKAQSVASAYLESKGISAGKMLDIAVAKMIESKNGGGQAWWDRISELTGIKEPDNAKLEPPQPNTQINVYNLNSPEVQDFNTKFEKFLHSYDRTVSTDPAPETVQT